MLKWIARKILYDEIESLEETKNALKNGNIELCEIIEEKRNKQLDLQKQIFESLEEKERLTKENKILRKYYDLDKEPSDEIKAKIHIELELNRVKEENLKLIAMVNRQPQYIPQPYPVYPPFGRGLF